MRQDNRLPRVLHALLHLDGMKDPATSDQLAEMLNTNAAAAGGVIAALILGVVVRHDAVDQSAVVLTDEDGARKRLVAYVVSPSSDLPVSELKGFLRERLPEDMVPAEFIGIDALPLTANGKLDRKALPSPEGVLQQTDHAFVAPRNEMERILAEIWSDVLGVEQIGVHDNFFDLGGVVLDHVPCIRLIGGKHFREIPHLALEPGLLARQIAQVVETRATNVTAALDLDFSHQGRLDGKDSLDSHSARDLAKRFSLRAPTNLGAAIWGMCLWYTESGISSQALRMTWLRSC